MEITIIEISDPSNFEKRDWQSGIFLFSDEWKDRLYQCRNFLNSHSKIYERKIHGRKCIIKEINSTVGKDFLLANHIQGSNNLGIVYFGLFYQEELIGVMSLGRHNRQNVENRIVLDRFCISYGVHVQGGASKLFAKCIEWAKSKEYEEIISFSDNRLTNGHIYEILGFHLEKNHRPDYCYVDIKNPDKRISKQSQKKSSSKCPKNMTEIEWANLRGLKRLWDKGKKRWAYPLDPTKKTWKQKLSHKCAEQNKKGDFKHSHIRGYFYSNKCQCEIFYGSSYELRCIYLLEKDDNVLFFKRADVFVDSSGKSRNPDIEVFYHDQSREIIEIKPESRFQKEDDVKKQIFETKKHADSIGCKFSVWTEKNSGLQNDHAIIKWAKKFIAETTGNTDWIKKQKENNRKKAKKHYDTKIATNKVDFYCEFCKTNHSVLKLTYDRNITKNNHYICEKEGGKISGSRPKTHLMKDNPYKKDGKKKCVKCQKIKPFEEFSADKSRRDNYCSQCKMCRSDAMKVAYRQKK